LCRPIPNVDSGRTQHMVDKAENTEHTAQQAQDRGTRPVPALGNTDTLRRASVLRHTLSKKKAAICKKWLRLMVETYSGDVPTFLTQKKDKFTNPVGFIISHEIESIFDELLRGSDPDRLSSSLRNIIRIRAVQDFRPSEALAFVFHLKGVIREALAGELLDKETSEELQALDDSIDEMALLALDIYSECRERIHELKIGELKADRERAFVILERAQGIDRTANRRRTDGEEMKWHDGLTLTDRGDE